MIAIELKKACITYDKPIAVGMSILDLSKSLFYKLYYGTLKPLFGETTKCLYVDTDSYFLQCDKDPYNIIKQNPEFFDTSDYKVPNRYDIKPANKKIMGIVKDETAGKIITEYVGLKSKLYTYEIENTETKKKAKGVKKSAMRTISIEDYRNALFDGEPIYKKQKLIRSVDHEVSTVLTNKLVLDRKDDKREVAYNQVDTYPWGYVGNRD